jgi:hypothetical protein
MTKHVEYFGGTTHGHIIMADGRREDVWFNRELWFDRDFDGRWLVGVTNQYQAGGETTGAIVVQDQAIGAFIELLGQLVVNPDQFATGQLVIGPGWDGEQSHP